MLPDQFQLLLEKFSRGACTPEEEQLIDEWYRNIGAKEAPALPLGEKDLMEQKLWSTINPLPAPRRRNWLSGRAAIIILPILGAIAFYLSRQTFTTLNVGISENVAPAAPAKTYHRNEGSSPLKVALTDGSSVILQPLSEIILAEDFGATTREVQLKGEGFFQVSRDERKPFLVYANEVVTRVLGTSFNIRAYETDKEVTVAVRTGKVSVYANKTNTSHHAMQPREVILTPNQQMIYHRERAVLSKQLVEEPEIVLPNSDLFRMQFENADVSEIFEVLQKNYGVEIRFNRNMLGNCKLTTRMSDEGLYERIAVICKAIGASYSIDDDAVITIKSNGC